MVHLKQIYEEHNRERSGHDRPFTWRTNRLCIRFLSMLSLLLTALVILPSCTVSPTTTYPVVSFTEASEQTSSLSGIEPTETTSVSQGTTVIRVAAPISSQTAKYLSLLFSAKKQGLFPKGETGSTISSEFLLTIEPEFLVEAIQTPSTGATYEMVESWRNDGISPDVIYVNSLSPFQNNDRIIALNEYCASVNSLTPDHIYPDMLATCYIGDFLYGIPYSASAQILFWNQEVTKASGWNFLPFSISLSDLNTISSGIAALNPLPEEQTEQERFFTFLDPSQLLPFLPNAYDSKANWFVREGSGFQFKSEAFRKTASFLQAYSVQDSFSVEALTPEEHVQEFGNMDPRISGRVATWVGSSFDISYWSTALANVTITKLPSETQEKESPLALTVYPLCVSSDTENPKLAAEFAAFLATDEDAVLLTERLEKRAGFIPVLSSEAVWRLVFENQTYGDRLTEIKNDMDSAIYNPQTNQEEISQLIDIIIEKYGPRMILPDTEMEQLLTDMSIESKQSI